ncbi:MAG: acyltransferase [Chloroflexi bacterium]|nr:acyltransferase [Chloroflexota bacterium]
MEQEKLGPPQCAKIFTWISNIWLRLMGWKVEGNVPHIPKMVLIFAHHTSTWDFFIILPSAFSIGLKPNYLGKKQLFSGLLGWYFSAMGGIPVDRQSKTNTVDQIVTEIKKRDQVLIGIAPEGTRKHINHWKTGFYHIAYQAGVPITFGYLDYARKYAGFYQGFIPSGDMEADFQLIQNFFGKVTAKFPERMGEIAIKPGADVIEKS